MEFFKNFDHNFDQNSGWKCSCSWLQNSHGILQEFWLEYWWEEPTPHMILEFFKQFDPNFVWKWSCLFFDQNSSGKKNFWRIMKSFVSPIKKLINCRGGDVIRIFKNQMAVEFLWNSSRILIRILVGKFRGKHLKRLWNSLNNLLWI